VRGAQHEEKQLRLSEREHLRQLQELSRQRARERGTAFGLLSLADIISVPS